MVTLEEHNKRQAKKVGKIYRPNVACDKCGTPMQFNDWCIVFNDEPIRMPVVCPACGYKGLKIN